GVRSPLFQAHVTAPPEWFDLLRRRSRASRHAEQKSSHWFNIYLELTKAERQRVEVGLSEVTIFVVDMGEYLEWVERVTGLSNPEVSTLISAPSIRNDGRARPLGHIVMEYLAHR